MSGNQRTINAQLIRYSSAGILITVPHSLTVFVEPVYVPKKGYGVFRVMTPEDGDKRIVWNSQSLQEIQDAKEMFDAMIMKGLVPYRVGTQGKPTSEVMSEFDPHAEEVLFLPTSLIVGG